MTAKEAIDNLDYLISEDCTESQFGFIPEIEMAIEALEKQMPKKPDVYSDGYADGYEVWEEHCPNCVYDFDGHNPSYCPRCGQKIDWSEEE